MIGMLQRKIFGLCALALLAACGGGEGGGDGSTQGVGATTGARVLHAAIDLTPIDIFTDPEEAAATAKFGLPSPYVPLSSGPQGVLLRKAKSADTIENLSLSVEKGLRQSILVYGDYREPAIQVAVFQDIAPEFAKASSGVRIVNGLLDSGTAVAGALNGAVAFSIPYGGASEYLEVPSGVVNVLLDNGTQGVFSVEGGVSYTILLAGQEGYFVKLVQFTN